MVENYRKAIQLHVQACIIFLQVEMLVKVINVQGNNIEPTSITGINHRKSELKWPNQERLSEEAWKDWRKLLRSFTNKSRGTNTYLQNLEKQ